MNEPSVIPAAPPAVVDVAIDQWETEGGAVGAERGCERQAAHFNVTPAAELQGPEPLIRALLDPALSAAIQRQLVHAVLSRCGWPQPAADHASADRQAGLEAELTREIRRHIAQIVPAVLRAQDPGRLAAYALGTLHQWLLHDLELIYGPKRARTICSVFSLAAPASTQPQPNRG